MDLKAYCFVHFVSEDMIGGGETLILRKGRWLVNNGYAVIVITLEGAMADLCRENGFIVFTLERGLGSDILLDRLGLPKFNECITSILRELNTHSLRVHYVECMNEIGLHWTAWLSMCTNAVGIAGIVHPKTYGGAYRKSILNFAEHGVLYSVNEACLRSHEHVLGSKLPIDKVYIHKVGIEVPLPNELYNSLDERHDECFRILTVSRLDRDKEYVFGLIDVVNDLLQEHRNLRLTVVGDGPYRKSLERRSSKGLHSIEFVGSVHPDELEKYYQKCDVLVGMGTSALHAAAWGKPTIISVFREPNPVCYGFFCDVKEDAFGEKITGLNTVPLRNVLEELLKDPTKRKKIGRMCYEKAVEFSIDKVMRDWMDYLERRQREIKEHILYPVYLDELSPAIYWRRRASYLKSFLRRFSVVKYALRYLKKY